MNVTLDNGECRSIALSDDDAGRELQHLVSDGQVRAIHSAEATLEDVFIDLRRKYGSDYRVLRAGSGPEAIEIVRELKIRNNSIALFLIDQRMPGMSGVEFLTR